MVKNNHEAISVTVTETFTELEIPMYNHKVHLYAVMCGVLLTELETVITDVINSSSPSVGENK